MVAYQHEAQAQVGPRVCVVHVPLEWSLVAHKGAELGAQNRWAPISAKQGAKELQSIQGYRQRQHVGPF